MAQHLPLIESRTDTDRRATGVAPRRTAHKARAFAVASDRPGQLFEIPGADWRIDQHTKEVGIAGVAAARRALAAAGSLSM